MNTPHPPPHIHMSLELYRNDYRVSTDEERFRNGTTSRWCSDGHVEYIVNKVQMVVSTRQGILQCIVGSKITDPQNKTCTRKGVGVCVLNTSNKY